MSADSSGGEDMDKMYSPKRNKKIVRIVTVMGYIFSVSTGINSLDLKYFKTIKEKIITIVTVMGYFSVYRQKSLTLNIVKYKRKRHL